jgi:hypothetical protein
LGISFEEASGVTTISGTAIVVVAFFAYFKPSVATASYEAVFQLTSGCTTITLERVSIVTRFTVVIAISVDDLIATSWVQTVLAAGIGGRIGVAASEITFFLLTTLDEVDHKVTTLRRFTVCTTGSR